MTSPPLVTIAVTNFNHRRFLPERFESLMSQTYRHFEVLFLDDASIDGSVAYARKMGGALPMEIIAGGVNRGVFSQWQLAIAQAKGEFVWIAEADDRCENEFLEELVGLALKYPSAGLVYSQSSIIDERGGLIEKTPSYLNELGSDRWEHDFFSKGEDEVRRFLVLRNTLPNASACLFRRSVLQSIDFKELPMVLCGDWLLYARILRAHDLAFCSAPLNHFRRHRGSVRAASDRGELRIRESYLVQKFIFDHFDITREVRELAVRFTFREWLYLCRSRAIPDQLNACSMDLLTAARAADPCIEERFAQSTIQILPVVELRHRSLQTGYRWRSNWHAYRDDREVVLRIDACRGETLIDPLSKSGEATIRRLEFMESGSDDVKLAVEGALLNEYLKPALVDHPVRVGADGVHVRRGNSAFLLSVIPPRELIGRSFALSLTIRAVQPRLLLD